MKDSIYRQAAIDAFRKELCAEETESCREYAIGFFGIERVLNDLPAAQPEQRWIPCSETVDIPEHEVLACDKYGEQIIGFLMYADDQWLCESNESMMYDPIAWMPLPEPYKER